MSINWIATNPKSNVKNQVNQTPTCDAEFESLMRTIVHVNYREKKSNIKYNFLEIQDFIFILKNSKLKNRNENGYEEKLEILLLFKGFFSAEQVIN